MAGLRAVAAAALLLAPAHGAAHSKTARHGPEAWQIKQCGPGNLRNQWTAQVNPANPWPEDPRPALTGRVWASLNGIWEYTTVSGLDAPVPFGTPLNETILVPFPPESCLSGLGAFEDWPNSTPDYRYAFYRNVFDLPANLPAPGSGSSYVLHIGACDWNCSVFVGGQAVVSQHLGGYDEIEVDVTALLKASDNEVIVFAHDPTEQGAQPNGKQRISQILNPGGDTYSPTSGIWQTVWLEAKPASFAIDSVVLTPNTSAVTVTVTASGSAGAAGSVSATASLDGQVVAHGAGAVGAPFVVHVPQPQLWSPDSPTLYNISITATGPGGAADTVASYFGLRTFTLQPYATPGTPATGAQVGVDRPGGDLPGSPFTLPSADYNLCWAQCNATAACLAWAYAVPESSVPSCTGYKKPTCWLKGADFGAPGDNTCRVSGQQATPGGQSMRPALNGEPIFIAGQLDQSWWSDGHYTAPTDEALAFDLQANQRYGYNALRLHQKVNMQRWYYHADVLGTIVLHDAVQKYGGASNATVPYYLHDLSRMIDQRYNHPSIVQWETFNEGDCWQVFNVSEVVAWTQQRDPSRLVDTDSGGGANSQDIGDVNDIHSYPSPRTPQARANQYSMVGEFGGLGESALPNGNMWVPGKCQAYLNLASPAAMAGTYINYTQTIYEHQDVISAVIYTQVTDVERECDGWLAMDRTLKTDAQLTAALAAANQALIKGTSPRAAADAVLRGGQ